MSPASDRVALADQAVDVILRDGTTLRLRAPTAGDESALAACFAELSERSRYLRFHGIRCVDERLVELFLDPDWIERGALVGTLQGRIVGLADYVRLRDPAAAEVAFVVADELQGRGLGTRLLEQLAARAAAVGIERFVAEVMVDNQPMLEVFAGAGFEVVRELEGGQVEVRISIRPTERVRRVGRERHSVLPRSDPTARGRCGRREDRAMLTPYRKRGEVERCG